MTRLLLLFLTAILTAPAQQYTRGIGVYPGDPKEDFSPTMAVDATTYRNLALHRAAYQSSSYDYNLAASLITDGIKETALPRWVTVTVSGMAAGGRGPAPAVAPGAGGPVTLRSVQREFLLDDNLYSTLTLSGSPWIQIGLIGGDAPPAVDRVEVLLRPGGGGGRGGQPQPSGWTCTVSASDDAKTWKEVGRGSGTERPSRMPVALTAATRARYYKVEMASPGMTSWQVAELSLFDMGVQMRVGGPYNFSSAWMSAGSGQEWVYVDLGAPCTFDRVALSWIRRAAEGSIQVSDDAAKWTTVQALPAGPGLTDDIKLAQPAKGRYVRVLMTKPASPEGYILSELEVYGRGGPVARPKPAPAAQADGRLNLAGGAWRVERASQVKADGAAISKPGFADRDWLAATVPGTVLTSFLNVGAVANPDFGDYQYTISDSYFCADFWYRNEFTAPPAAKGKHVWLNLDGINWKADVFLNGSKVGRIEGAFMRGRFDVTAAIHPGARNALAVRIEKNANPGSVKDKGQAFAGSGGATGADSPTYNASIGWDWISTIRGRDIGIWNNVFLSQTGPVTIEDPRVATALPLPDTSRADVTIEATLRNQESRPVSGVLRGRFGSAVFETAVSLDASAAKTVKLDPATTPALRLANPKLWWPNGYGDPNLYPVELKFETAGKAVSDSKSFQAGVRQFTYSEEGQRLRIWINGRRFVPRGGNWGFPESMLRYRAREYDVAVRYHRDMNFTMIRNWVGMTGDEPFYDACDKYGIVVWQDFWLANPVDGPNPNDDDLFVKNARDYVMRIRNHASMGLYCGRNEGVPLKPLDDRLRALTAELHPDLHYIPSSADDNQQGTGTYVVTGHGPYSGQTLRNYFANAPIKLHSEMGAPNVTTMDSLKLMMPEAAWWPQGPMWALHDSFARGGNAYPQYGGAANIEDFMALAQFVDYDTYRGMFEGQSKNRQGILIWMSHSAWPDMLWQTYDYFFDPDAGYFGAKKGSEPLHIQWNAATDMLEVVNYNAGEARGLTAKAEVLSMDGSVKWEKSAAVDSREDSVESPFKIEYPAEASPVNFIRLTLTRGGETVSSNFYLHPAQEGNYRAIRELPKVNLRASMAGQRKGDRWILTTELQNPSDRPALMVRVKAVRAKSGDRILPALHSDNYVALMPGERKTIVTEILLADTRGEAPSVVVDGFNVGSVAVASKMPK
jgi:hypothetical protein